MSNLEKEETNSLKYRMIGAVVVLVLAILLLSMVLDKKGASDESARSSKSALSNSKTLSKEEFISRIQPIGHDFDNNEEINIKMDQYDQPKPDEVLSSNSSGVDQDIETSQAADVSENFEPDDSLAPMSESTTASSEQNEEPNIVDTEVESNTAQEAQEEQGESNNVPVETTATDQAVAEPQVEVAQEESPKEETPKATDSFPNEDVSVGWVVRVGTFSNPENVQKMIDVLNANGFQTRYETVTTSSQKQATRVWVGPFQKRVTAGRAVNKIQSATGVEPFIKVFP